MVYNIVREVYNSAIVYSETFYFELSIVKHNSAIQSHVLIKILLHSNISYF